MTDHTSLLELTNQLIHDAGARSAFAADPAGFLAGHGVTELTPSEVADGLGHVADGLPPHLAIQLEPAGGATLDDPTDGLVSQFQVVADVDPTATIPELDDHLDTLDLTDAGDVDPHDLVDRVDGDDSTGDDTGADDTTDADTPDADTTDDTVDLGFGSGDGATDDGLPGDVVEPGGLDELDAAFADLDATLAVDVGADLDATSLYEDPAGFDDPYLTPDPVDRDPGDADDLDADNGNWDGDFSHDDGHGML